MYFYYIVSQYFETILNHTNVITIPILPAGEWETVGTGKLRLSMTMMTSVKLALSLSARAVQFCLISSLRYFIIQMVQAHLQICQHVSKNVSIMNECSITRKWDASYLLLKTVHCHDRARGFSIQLSLQHLYFKHTPSIAYYFFKACICGSKVVKKLHLVYLLRNDSIAYIYVISTQVSLPQYHMFNT